MWTDDTSFEPISTFDKLINEYEELPVVRGLGKEFGSMIV